MSLPSFFDVVAASLAPRAGRAVPDADIRRAAESFRPMLVADARTAQLPGTAHSLRILASMVARIYASIGIEVPGPLGAELAGLVRAINPRIEMSTRGSTVSVVCGDARPDGPTIWCGGNGWTVRVSTTEPVPQSANPLTAMVAGAVVAGELGRRAFNAVLPPDWEPCEELTLSLLSYGVGANVDGEWPEQVPVGTLHLVGAGAIGSAFAYGMAACRHLGGTLHVIDNQTIDLANLQRYLIAKPIHVQQHLKKTAIVRETLERAGFRVKAYDWTWQRYLAAQPDRWRFDRVITALDSAPVRRLVQAALPREILNGGVGLTQLNVGRYTFDGMHECLACAYLHVPPPDIFVLMTGAFGLPLERVQELDTANQPFAPVDVAIIERHTGRPRELRHLVGLTPRSAYARMCGFAAPAANRGNEGALVPLAHAPILSGLLLAVETVKAVTPSLAAYRLPHVLEIDLRYALVTSSVLLQEQWRTETPCICVDPAYRAVYTQRWM